jgi:hypothetical protein
MPYYHINKTKLLLCIGLLMAISYPLEVDENPDFYRSMIEFKIYDTEPAELIQMAAKPSMESANAESGFSVSSFLGDLFSNPTVAAASQGKLDLPKSKAGSPREIITPAAGFESIKLYMPVSFSQTDTFSYQNTELGTVGAAGAAALRAGATLPGAVGAALNEGFAGITDMLDAVLGSGKLGEIGAARVAQKVGSLSAGGQAAIEQASQVVMNPNIRASFKSVGLRKFAFQFNMIPKNSHEADAIDALIYEFRRAAYPEELTAGGVSLAFRYPQLFRIIPKVRTDRGFEVMVGTPIQYCYLESITVNTNPIGNNTFHADGSAIQTDLSLSFVEYKTLARQDIRAGYKPVDADPQSPKADTSVKRGHNFTTVNTPANPGPFD